ncbi:hypothetical protein UlMin_046093 [Ulmus minor]
MSFLQHIFHKKIEYVHVHIQQQNGRKNLTIVQGLTKEFKYNKTLKDPKKELCYNGTIVQDPELGQSTYLVVERDNISLLKR